MEETDSSLELPGFRFYPTEEELLGFYLKNMVHGKKMNLDIICFLNIYRHDPWNLPGLAKIGEREWYFFVPRDRKHSNGGRPNRTTEHGFWKTTGSDRKVVTLSEPKRVIGWRKTLVFYQGRAPRGSKTDWVMNEYCLTNNCPQDIVLCKIYRKARSLKELELRAAKEEAGDKSNESYPTSPLSSSNAISSFYQWQDLTPPTLMTLKTEQRSYDHEIPMQTTCKLASTSNTIQMPFGIENLGELQLPKLGTDWAQDPFCSQLWSPWLDSLQNFWSPTLIPSISN